MAHNDHAYTSLSSENVPKKKRRTGGYCCVAECNSSHSRGVSLHSFPSDESIKRQWVRFVQTRRKDFGSKFGTPNAYSFICEKHFKSECYPLSVSIKRSMGIKTNAALIPGSVPTIHKPVCVTASSMSTESTTTIVTQASTQAHSTTVTTSVLSSVCSILPGVSQVRGAYVKRGCQRVICELTASPPPDSTEDVAAAADNHVQPSSTFSTGDAGVQTNSCFVNTGKKTRTRSKRVQVHPSISFKGVQCNLDKERSTRMCSQSTQCDLNLDTSYCMQDQTPDQCEPASDPASGPEDTECCEQADDHDEDYIPVEEESMDTDSASDAEEKTDSQKFIVFEENLLELFQRCQYCAQPATGNITHIRGTFLSVKQECPHCGKDRVWMSQPFIKDIPAGNLYVSSAILFSGLLPSKAFRFLSHLGVASISHSTFFDHQRAFLFPAIEEEWKSHQARYVEKAGESDYSLTLGGDGRADSPGHSAKYGTYALLDLDLMMVIDTRVVQCNEEDVGSSCRMEKEGLKRCLSFVKDNGLDVCELVTDRNPSIIKHMKDNMPGVKHSFEVWHVAKVPLDRKQ